MILHYMREEFGNSGSRTHLFGQRAKSAVETARQQVADIVGAQKDEVIFTSGATESNNIAILGLSRALKGLDKTHIVTTQLEHKAVLEPCGFLESEGFKVTYVEPNSLGEIETTAIENALTARTGLVSLMQVNNETGVIQPIEEVADLLGSKDIFMHVDAAQGYGKLLDPLRNARIDLISISSHKIYGPKGVGALITRRRGYKKPPLEPIMFGGGQEKGLRPGTLPVPLIAGFGLASELALKNAGDWWQSCAIMRAKAISELNELNPHYIGANTLPNVINVSIPGINSEAAIVALKNVAAISNGSACTSSNYTSSHVLESMGLSKEHIEGALRISWCHMTPEVPWRAIVSNLKSLL